MINRLRSTSTFSPFQWMDLLWVGVSYLLLWIVGGWFIRLVMPENGLIVWSISTLAFSGYAFGYLLKHMHLNTPQNGDRLFPDLGWANRITLFRAGLLAWLFGFLFLPSLDGVVRWIPGILYALVAVLDFVDGWVARITHRSSRLGEALDMHWDSLGVLIACTLLVRLEQVPFPFLLVGLARFLYVAGLRWRQRKRLPLAPLPFNPYRRYMAGIQMGFIAVVLLPVFSPPATTVAAWLWMIPFLTAFLRDWLYVSMAMDEYSDPLFRWGVLAFLSRVFPPIFRLVTILSGGFLLVSLPPDFLPLWGRAIVVGLWLMVFSGILGRVAGIGWMIMGGLAISVIPHQWEAWGALVGGFGILMLGTGRLSVWTPEEWLIYHRAGEPS